MVGNLAEGKSPDSKEKELCVLVFKLMKGVKGGVMTDLLIPQKKLITFGD